MNETNIPDQTMAMTGPPVEIGAQVFMSLCLPIVKAANARPAIERQQLYCGFLSALMGSMIADFGQEQAVRIARTIVNAIDLEPLYSGSRAQ